MTCLVFDDHLMVTMMTLIMMMVILIVMMMAKMTVSCQKMLFVLREELNKLRQ